MTSTGLYDDEYWGVIRYARPRPLFAHSRHGSTTRYHRPRRVEIHWWQGEMQYHRTQMACAMKLITAVMTDDPPDGLQPCPGCFPAVVDVAAMLRQRHGSAV